MPVKAIVHEIMTVMGRYESTLPVHGDRNCTHSRFAVADASPLSSPSCNEKLAQSHFMPGRARKRAFTRDFVHKSGPARECPALATPRPATWGFYW